MEEAKNLGGKPPMYTSPEELSKKVDSYFEDEDSPTWSGLALYLGFNSRQALNYYMDEKPGYLDPLKKALLKIEIEYEKGLAGRNPAGSIFALKNFGWTDRQEVVSRNVNYNSELTQDEIKKISQSLNEDV